MTPETFTYWLQGFVELSESNSVPNEKQWLMIKDHLKLVFDKKTPDRNLSLKDMFPNLPTDYKRLSDLIGKDSIQSPGTWPYAVTC